MGGGAGDEGRTPRIYDFYIKKADSLLTHIEHFHFLLPIIKKVAGKENSMTQKGVFSIININSNILNFNTLQNKFLDSKFLLDIFLVPLFHVIFSFMSVKGNPILLRYGGAQKSVFEMSQEELQQVAASVLRRAKEKAFYKGLPIYYAKKDKLIAEYLDGRISTVEIR